MLYNPLFAILAHDIDRGSTLLYGILELREMPISFFLDHLFFATRKNWWGGISEPDDRSTTAWILRVKAISSTCNASLSSLAPRECYCCWWARLLNISSIQKTSNLTTFALFLFFSNISVSSTALNGQTRVEVKVGEGEPIESALRRFKREVNKSGHLMDLRHKRYFENSQDRKKRKIVQARFRKRMERMQARRMRQQRT